MSFFQGIETSRPLDKPEDIHRHPLTGISVLVVGAGPVGLYTALECWRKGHNVVKVIERAPGPSSAGDSFTVNCSHIQKTWPAVFAAVEEASPDLLIAFHKITGERVAGPVPYDIKATANGRLADDGGSGPSKVYRVPRAKFAATLRAQVQALGIEISFGQRVADYFEDDTRGGVVLDDGTRLDADVVVAADGVGTKSHRLVSGRDVRAMASGRSIFRTAYPVELAVSDPELAERFPLVEGGRGVFEMWTGSDINIVVYRGPERMEWLITHKDIAGTSQESWGDFVTGDQVAEYLSGFPEIPEYLKKLVRTAPDSSVVDWKLLWRDPQPSWVSPKGRVVQAGDSAHTFLPSSGSGVNQGIEDAIGLATCLQLGGNVKTGMWARVHNKLRFERVACAQFMGFVNQTRYLNPDWGVKAVKDLDATKVQPEYGWWLLAHNAEHYAYCNYGKAARHLVDGTDFVNTNIPPGYTYKPWTLKEVYDTLSRGEKLKLEGDWS